MADITNSEVWTIVNGTEEADSIVSNEAVEWYESAGNFTGYIYGEDTINAGAGNDTIVNHTFRTSINGGEGDDYIYNDSWADTVNGDAGNDTIVSNNAKHSLTYTRLNGGAGNDSIVNRGGLSGGTSTINGGAGDDTIDIDGATRVKLQYAAGDGNDVVIGYYDCDTIQLTSGSLGGAELSGDDVVFRIGDGSITVRDAKGKIINMIDASGAVSRIAYTDDGSINATHYTASYSTFNGTGGNDYISSSGNNSTVNGGAGDDVIVGNLDDNSSINVNGGTGNDTVVASNMLTFRYADGDGDDVIVGYHHYNTRESVLKISGATITKANLFYTDNDYIIRVGNGSITLKNTLNDNYTDHVVIEDNGGRKNFAKSDFTEIPRGEIVNYNDNSLVSGTSGVDTIRNYGSNVTLNAGAEADIVSNEGTRVIVNGDDGADVIENGGTYATNGSDTSLYPGALSTLDGGDGNDLITNSNAGSVKASGGDGNDSINVNGLNAESMTIEGGKGDDAIKFVGAGSNNLISYNLGDGYDTITNFGANDTLALGEGVVILNQTIEGNDYIINVGTSRFTSVGSITFENGAGMPFKVDGSNIVIDNEIPEAPEDSQFVKVTLNSRDNARVYPPYDDNWGVDYYIINTGENVTIQSPGGKDTIEASDLYGEVFAYDNVSGNDTILNFASNDTIKITSGRLTSSVVSGADMILNVGNNTSINLKNAASYEFKVSSDGRTLTVGGINRILNRKDDQTITGSINDDYITNTGENVVIEGKAGNDTITGSEYGEVIRFASDGGQDVVTNFGENDTIRITAGNIQAINKDGDDYIIDVRGSRYSGTLTLKDVGNYLLKQNGNVITVDKVNQIINRTDRAKVNGTNGRDYIVNSGANATIQANQGDDTVEGSDNAEVFAFSSADGNNVITNFGVGDTLKMTQGKTLSYAADGDDMVVTLKGTSYTGTVRLVDAADRQFTKSGTSLYVKSVNRITNTNDRRTVTGTSNADYIVNSGQNVTVNAGAGNDTIEASAAYGEVFRFSATDGKDVITNFGANDTLYVTNGTISTSIRGNDLYVTVTDGLNSGRVRLRNASGYTFKQDGAKFYVDNINYAMNANDSIPFEGTDGMDYMINSGDRVTVQPGAGNDTILAGNLPEVFALSSADGNNKIYNFGMNDTLQMTAGKTMSFEKSEDGRDYIVTLKGTSYTAVETLVGAGIYNLKKSGTTKLVGDEIATIANRNNNRKVSGTSDAEIIINTGNRVTVEGKGGDDTITGSDVYGERFLFSSADGNNVITNFGKNDTLQMTAGASLTFAKEDNDYVVTLKGTSYTGTVRLLDTGNYQFVKKSNTLLTVDPTDNTLTNYSDSVKFNGTDGADYMINNGQYVTIAAGGGADTIEASDFYGEVFAFSSADGRNVIQNFGLNDTLKMTAGKTLSFATVGNDVVVTLAGASYTGTVTLQDAAGMPFKKSGTNLIVDGVTNILNRSDNQKVSGTDGRDYIINVGNRATINGAGGDDTINGANYGEVFQFASDGGNDQIVNFEANDTLQIVAGQIDTDASGRVGDDYVVYVKSPAYSGSITLKDAGNYQFVRDGNFLTVNQVNYINNRNDGKKVTGSNERDYITNSGERVTIQANGGADTIEGSSFGEVFAFSSADGNNVITNFGANDTLKMTAGSSLTFATVGSDVVVTLKGTSYTGIETLVGAAGLPLKKSGNNLFVSLPTQLINTTDNVKFNGTAQADYIVNSGENVTIASGEGNDTIEGSNYAELFQFASNQGKNVVTNFGTNDSIQATAGTISGFSRSGSSTIVTLKGTSYTGTVTLKNTSGHDFVIGGNGRYLTVDAVETISNSDDKILLAGTSGRDYIVNSGQNVTIQAGPGADTIEGSVFGERFDFSSADGNNVITNFGSNDTLRMTAGKTLSFATVGADVVVTLKGASFTGTVTLQDAAGLNFQKSGVNLTVGSINNKLNPTNGVKVTGTSGADYIINTGDRVTVEAKGGSDTIVGSDTYGELFNFSSADGNNVIVNFGANDTLTMTAGSTISYAADDGDYVITLKGASYTGTVRLLDAANVGTLRTSTNGRSVMLWPNDSSAQLAASTEDYWFDQTGEAEDELKQIMSSETSVSFEFDPSEQFKPKDLELVQASARSRDKK